MNAFDKVSIARKLRSEQAAASLYTEQQRALIEKRMTPQKYLFGLFQTKAMSHDEATKSLNHICADNIDFNYAEADRKDRLEFLGRTIRMVRDVEGPTINLTANEYNRIMGFIY